MKKELLNNTQVKPLILPTVTPVSAGTATTLWLPRTEFMSAIASVAVGAATGTPTAQSVVATVQSAADASGTGAANLLDIEGNAITISLLEDDVSADAGIDLSGAQAFIGLSVVTGFTGGTTPAIPMNAFIALGDPRDTRNI